MRAALVETSAKPSRNRKRCEWSKAPLVEHIPDLNTNLMMQTLEPFLVRFSLAVWLTSTPVIAAEPVLIRPDERTLH